MFQSGWNKLHIFSRNSFEVEGTVYPTVAHYVYIQRAKAAGHFTAAKQMHETMSPQSAQCGQDNIDLNDQESYWLLLSA